MAVDGSFMGGDLVAGRGFGRSWERRAAALSAVLLLLVALVAAVPRAEADPGDMLTYSGTITAQDGSPLSGIIVRAEHELSNYPNPSSRVALGEATTDSSGNWSITFTQPERLARWDLDIIATDPDGDYVRERIEIEFPTDSLSSVAGLDAVLKTGGRFSGRILVGGAPPPSTNTPFKIRWGAGDPDPFTSFWGAVAIVLDVAEDGAYTTPALSDGSWVLVYPSDLDDTYAYEGVLGSIVDGEDVEVDHEVGHRSVSVSGRVTDSSGNGVGGIAVTAEQGLRSSSSGFGGRYSERVRRSGSINSASIKRASPVGGRYLDHLGFTTKDRYEAVTASDGTYSFTANSNRDLLVKFGSLYWVHARGHDDNGVEFDYVPEFYDDKATLGQADWVRTPARGEVTNIDAQLSRGGSVSGVVSDSSGDPVRRWASVSICASPICDVMQYQSIDYNSQGFFDFTGLAAGTYELRVSDRTGEETREVVVSEGTRQHFDVVIGPDAGGDAGIFPGMDASDIFDDIDDGDPHERAVGWMFYQGVTTGCSTAPALFCPERGLTRAEFVTFLWRAALEPEPAEPGSAVFGDVGAGHFADQAVGWAVDQGVTTGCAQQSAAASARFCPDAPVTRAQIATFLHRFVKEPHYGNDQGFADVGEGLYYSRPVAWTAATEFIPGCAAGPPAGGSGGQHPSQGSFCPDQPATRATAATFIHKTARNYLHVFRGF
ncbi:MAG: S-layer homology domain-containing protein [Acidimicrobiaceae bacterium]|nr:S-layer homology domain-containing protein [Acidimicrobiaceae bacterium]